MLMEDGCEAYDDNCRNTPNSIKQTPILQVVMGLVMLANVKQILTAMATWMQWMQATSYWILAGVPTMIDERRMVVLWLF